MYRLLILFFFIFSCSKSDSLEQTNIVYNYIYSSTIPQIIESEKVDRKFWVRAPKKIVKNKYPIVFFLSWKWGGGL